MDIKIYFSMLMTVADEDVIILFEFGSLDQLLLA